LAIPISNYQFPITHFMTRFRFDPGFFIVALISLIAIWPFVSRASLPQGSDAELHIFRLAELTWLTQAGEIYPRWAPNFYYGFGYPIFNYYAPLTYYLGLPVALLPWFDAVDGVKFVLILGLLAVAVGVYGFVRDNWGRAAGFVAAAVAVYAPYLQYVDPHARGDLAEAFSFGAFALALWGMDRLRRRPSTGRWIMASLLVAAVILSHNLMALVCFGLLLAWAAWRIGEDWLTQTREGAKAPSVTFAPLREIMILFGPLLLGVGLAAFFWLPVALEQNAVNLNTLIGEGDNFDFRNHFLSLATLLGEAPRLDWGASEAHFVFNLGLAQWALGLLGVIALAVGRAANGRHLSFFALAAAGLIFMMLPISIWLWELIPLMAFMQFPWRLLGVAVILLAVLAGVGAAGLSGYFPANWRNWVAATAVGLTILLALPLSEVPPWEPDFGPVNSTRVAHIELAGHWLGTTSTADFLPVTVEVLPTPEGQLLLALFEGRELDRVNRAALPAGATVESVEKRPLHFQYQTQSDEDFLLRLFLFDFPGWTARIDGRPVETEIGLPEGFLVVPVPAGDQIVDVRFEATPARRLATAVSWLALLFTLAGAFWLRPGRGGRSGRGEETVEPFSWRANGPLVGITLLVTAVYLLVLSPAGWLRDESTGYTALPAQTAVFADFDDQIVLIGYDLSTDSARPGESVTVTLYWKAKQAPLPVNYQVFAHLLAEDGVLVAQSDKLNPGEFPTRRWTTEKYVRDRHELQLPDDLPPGRYILSTGLWAAFEGWRLPLVDENGRQIGDNYRLPVEFIAR
jgi:hypothetical protein